MDQNAALTVYDVWLVVSPQPLQTGLYLGLIFTFTGEISFLSSYVKAPSSHVLEYQYLKILATAHSL